MTHKILLKNGQQLCEEFDNSEDNELEEDPCQQRLLFEVSTIMDRTFPTKSNNSGTSSKKKSRSNNLRNSDSDDEQQQDSLSSTSTLLARQASFLQSSSANRIGNSGNYNSQIQRRLQSDGIGTGGGAKRLPSILKPTSSSSGAFSAKDSSIDDDCESCDGNDDDDFEDEDEDIDEDDQEDLQLIHTSNSNKVQKKPAKNSKPDYTSFEAIEKFRQDLEEEKASFNNKTSNFGNSTTTTTTARTTVNSIGNDNEYLRDLKQYHYDRNNEQKDVITEASSNANRKSYTTKFNEDYNNENNDDERRRYNNTQVYDTFNKNRSFHTKDYQPLTSVSKISGAGADASTTVAAGGGTSSIFTTKQQLQPHPKYPVENDNRSLFLNNKVEILSRTSSSSSGGSLIATRDSASMTKSPIPIQRKDAASIANILSSDDEQNLSDKYSASQLVYVTEQLQGIQKTQDSILTQLKRDMDLLQLDNTKLKRENESLRARTFQMNGVIDDLTISLDRVKKQLTAQASKSNASISGEADPGTSSYNHNSDVEEDYEKFKNGNNNTKINSSSKILNKYGIHLTNANKIQSKESLSNSASAAILEIDVPKEIKVKSSTVTRKSDGRRKNSNASAENASSSSKKVREQVAKRKPSDSLPLPPGMLENEDEELNGKRESSRRAAGHRSSHHKSSKQLSSSRRKSKERNNIRNNDNQKEKSRRHGEHHVVSSREEFEDYEDDRRGENVKSRTRVNQAARKNMKLTKKDSQKIKNGILECFGFHTKKEKKKNKTRRTSSTTKNDDFVEDLQATPSDSNSTIEDMKYNRRDAAARRKESRERNRDRDRSRHNSESNFRQKKVKAPASAVEDYEDDDEI